MTLADGYQFPPAAVCPANLAIPIKRFCSQRRSGRDHDNPIDLLSTSERAQLKRCSLRSESLRKSTLPSPTQNHWSPAPWLPYSDQCIIAAFFR